MKLTLKHYVEKTFQKVKSIETLKFRSPGKLLLTGEYLVLKGAESIGFRTKFGQSLEVQKSSDSFHSWRAFDLNGKEWLDFKFKLEDGSFKVIDEYGLNKVSKKKVEMLFKLLSYIHKEETELFASPLSFTTHLEFEREWGLGTSSTLVANLAKWSGLDPYELLKISFGGSGYDLAIAMENKHLLYCLQEGSPRSQSIEFNPKFRDQVFFVYLNEKRSSRDAIASFYKNVGSTELLNYQQNIQAINKCILSTKSLKEFEEALFEHETILSTILKEETVKERLFADYIGGICKSLGAWGGDFILVTGGQENWTYFRNKGYETILSYEEIIA